MLLLFLLRVKTPVTALLLLVTNKVVDPFNYRPSATSLALKFPANIKLLLAVFNNFRNTATTTFNTLATQLRLMALQTRCTVNVITPSFHNYCRGMLTFLIDNGAPQPKYDH